MSQLEPEHSEQQAFRDYSIVPLVTDATKHESAQL